MTAGGRGPTLAPSLLDLDLGFVALSRRLCASPFYRALRPDERSVVVEALLAARYAPGGEFWFAGQRISLAVGQFIDSEEEIARRAGVTRKVVRTTYRKMMVAGLMDRSRAHPAGQCPFIATIVGYERILPAAESEGPRTEQPTGHEGAQNGPTEGPPTGHEGAPSEQGNKGTTEPGDGDPASSPAPPARRAKRRKAGGEPDPHHRPLQGRLEAVFLEVRGVRYGFQPRDAKAIAELLRLSGDDVAEVEARWRRGLELGERWPGCATFGQLAQKWNDLAARVQRPPRAATVFRPSGSPELDRVLAAAGERDPWGVQTILESMKAARFRAGVFTLEAAGEVEAQVLETWRERLEAAARRVLGSDAIEVHVTITRPAGAVALGGGR